MITGLFTNRIGRIALHFTHGAIIDLNDRRIKQLSSVSNNAIIVSNIVAGAYIISIPDVFDAGKSFTEKVVITK